MSHLRWVALAMVSGLVTGLGAWRDPEARAALLDSPLPAPGVDPDVVHQPFVIFQKLDAVQHLFHIQGDAPIFWVILALLLVFGLMLAYSHSS